MHCGAQRKASFHPPGAAGWFLAATVVLACAFRVPDPMLPTRTRIDPGEQGLPIPAGTNAVTWVMENAKAYRFILRNLTRDAENSASGTQSDADATRSYLERAAASFAGISNAPTTADILASGEQLIAQGCQDPLVWYCHGAFLHASGRIDQAKPWLLRTAVEILDRPGYSAFRKAFLCARLAEIYQSDRYVHQQEHGAWLDRAVYWMVRALTTEPYGDDDLRFIYRHFDYYWNSVYGKRRGLAETLAKTNGANPWIASLIQSRGHIWEAWRLRGGGWASTVSPEAWEGFSDHLDQARSALETAWKLHPEFPEPAAEMITIVMGGAAEPDEGARFWFDRAVAAQLDYYPAYEKYRWARMPRWGGSLEILHAFARECLATRRFHTDVPFQYFEAIREMDNDEDGDPDIWTRSSVYPELVDMFTNYIAHSSGTTRQANQTLLAASAWKCERYAEAVAWLTQFEGQMDSKVAEKRFGVSLDFIGRDAAMRAAPWFPELARVERIAQTNLMRAVEQARTLHATTPEGENSRALLLARVRQMEQRLAFDHGEWVSLDVPPDFAGWIIHSGSWSVDPAGTLTATSSVNGLWIEWEPALSGELHLEGDVELVESWYKDKFNGGVTLHPGQDPPTFKSSPFASLLLFKSERAAQLSKSFAENNRATLAAPLQSVNRLEAKIRGDRITTLVNGKVIHDQAQIEEVDVSRPRRIGFGGNYWYPGSVIRFQHWRVRRDLASAP